MGEVWVAGAIAVGGAVVSGYANSKAQDKAAKQAQKNELAGNKDEARWSGILSQFNAAQNYYYEQKNRQNKERGLSEFRKWNSVQDFAPGYTQDQNTGVQVPKEAKIDDYIPEEEKKQGGGKGRSLIDKLHNPLGL